LGWVGLNEIELGVLDLEFRHIKHLTTGTKNLRSLPKLLAQLKAPQNVAIYFLAHDWF